MGGGLCQFATTLFNAAFFAGLPIVERHPHDFYIDHYPIGRDAQVAYGSQDLKFRNDTGHALLLRCWAGSGQVTVVLVGTTGRTVTLHDEPLLRPHAVGHVASHPSVITDDTLDRGVVVYEHGLRRTHRQGRAHRQAGRPGAVQGHVRVDLRAQGLGQAHRHEASAEAPGDRRFRPSWR